MENQQERLEMNMHWFAGFFEAEGWFSLMKTNRPYKGEMRVVYVPTCGICNTDFQILEGIKRLFLLNGIEYQLHLRAPRKVTHKKSWQIHISALKRSIIFIEWIIPYLFGDKKIKAQKILEFSKSRKEKVSSGWCGVGYSEEDIKLYEDIISKIPNDYTPNAER
jgi:LAGLIDADG endonuclease